MGLLSAIFGSSKSTTTTTQNTTAVDAPDNRVAAADYGIALGQDGNLDQSIHLNDESRTNIRVETLADDVALGAIYGSTRLGESAFALVGQGLEAQAIAARENRLLNENALGAIADNSRRSLDATLSVLDGSNYRALDLAAAAINRGQDESAAARSGAEKTITEVLGFKEAGDTKVAQDLIKYGAIAVALVVGVLLFRPRRAS